VVVTGKLRLHLASKKLCRKGLLHETFECDTSLLGLLPWGLLGRRS